MVDERIALCQLGIVMKAKYVINSYDCGGRRRTPVEEDDRSRRRSYTMEADRKRRSAKRYERRNHRKETFVEPDGRTEVPPRYQPTQHVHDRGRYRNHKAAAEVDHRYKYFAEGDPYKTRPSVPKWMPDQFTAAERSFGLEPSSRVSRRHKNSVEESRRQRSAERSYRRKSNPKRGCIPISSLGPEKGHEFYGENNHAQRSTFATDPRLQPSATDVRAHYVSEEAGRDHRYSRSGHRTHHESGYYKQEHSQLPEECAQQGFSRSAERRHYGRRNKALNFSVSGHPHRVRRSHDDGMVQRFWYKDQCGRRYLVNDDWSHRQPAESGWRPDKCTEHDCVGQFGEGNERNREATRRDDRRRRASFAKEWVRSSPLESSRRREELMGDDPNHLFWHEMDHRESPERGGWSCGSSCDSGSRCKSPRAHRRHNRSSSGSRTNRERSCYDNNRNRSSGERKGRSGGRCDRRTSCDDCRRRCSSAGSIARRSPSCDYEGQSGTVSDEELRHALFNMLREHEPGNEWHSSHGRTAGETRTGHSDRTRSRR